MHRRSRPTRQAATQLLVVLLLSACADLPSSAGSGMAEDTTISVVGGDGQVGQTGTVLRTPLRVHVRDSRGRPLAGASVQWIVQDPDLVNPSESTTDVNGEAMTHWTPRVVAAERVLRARVGTREVAFHATIEPGPASEGSGVTLVDIETFDGSGQVVHPDVAEVSWLGTGSQRFLALTPYPFGDAMKENPSIYVSTGSDHEWRVPEGSANPVATTSIGHLSDTDLVDDPQQRELRLYYRRAGDGNMLLVKTSGDGVTWSEPRALLWTHNHQLVSPTIVRRSAVAWEMWSVNSGNDGCSAYSTRVERRTSTDGYTWSDPVTVSMGASNHHVWHLDVQYVEPLEKYVAVYSVKTRTDCTTPAMFVATSADGLTWQHQTSPLLVRGVIPAFRHVVYRSTFLYSHASERFTFLHSGASYADGQWTWRMATERRAASDVLTGTLTAQEPGVTKVLGARSTAPALRIAP